MDPDRRLRYKEKIGWAAHRCNQIHEWISLYGSDSPMDEMPLLAIFKAYQEVIECLMDLIAMNLRDTDLPARDDYSNIERISLFSKKDQQVLSEMNGLRNRIIHRYNSTDERIALERIECFLPLIEDRLEDFRRWIQNS